MCIYIYGYYIYIHCTYYHILYHVNRRICLLLTSFNVGFNWYISCGSCLTIGVFPARLSFCWLNRSELSQLASAWWLNDDCGRDLWKNRRSLTGTTGASRLTGQRDLIAIGWNETQLAASWEKKHDCDFQKNSPGLFLANINSTGKDCRSAGVNSNVQRRHHKPITLGDIMWVMSMNNDQTISDHIRSSYVYYMFTINSITFHITSIVSPFFGVVSISRCHPGPHQRSAQGRSGAQGAQGGTKRWKSPGNLWPFLAVSSTSNQISRPKLDGWPIGWWRRLWRLSLQDHLGTLVRQIADFQIYWMHGCC